MRFGIWLFIHLLGMAMWLGSMLTLGMWTARARRTAEPRLISFTYSTARRLYKGVVTAGAVMTVLSGALLMVETGRGWFRPFPEHWLFQMQVVGLAAFLATIFYVVPNAGKLAALAERAVEHDVSSAEFGSRVKRQAIVASVIGVGLIYVVLLGGLQF